MFTVWTGKLIGPEAGPVLETYYLFIYHQPAYHIGMVVH